MQELDDLINELERRGRGGWHPDEILPVLRSARARIDELQKVIDAIATGYDPSHHRTA